MDVAQAFGIRLKDLRRRSRLSQEELASMAGLSKNFVSMMERGAQVASLETLHRLSKALGCEMADLVRLKSGGRPKKEPSPAERLARKVRALAKKAKPSEVARFERVARAYFRKATVAPREG